MRVLTLLAFGWCQAAFGQAEGPDRYRFPIPTSRGISGSFGEMRGSSFHFGLDVRTFERTGLPVVAAADGYVSRVRVSYSGYGKAIYIQHTLDSNTTVYAHVDSVLAPIQAELERLQRQSGVFDQELFFKPGEHPVRAGDTIAWSGNTGASQGPHLHYEIRSYNEWPQNPLAYHRQHIRDGLAPVIVRIGLEPLTAESRVEGLWEKHVITPKRSEATTYHPGVVRIEGRVGLEFVGYDRLFGSRNWNGVYRVRWLLDDQPRFECRFDRHGWEHVRAVLHYHDAVYARRSGQRYQKAYRDQGMDAPLYPQLVDEGVLELTDTAVHRLRLEVEDFHGNRATFTTRVQRARVPPPTPPAPAPTTRPSWEQRRGVLLLRGPMSRELTLVWADSSRTRHPVAYRNGGGLSVVLVPLVPGRAPVRAECADWAAPLAFEPGVVAGPAEATRLALGSAGSLEVGARGVFYPTYIPYSTRPGTADRVLSDIVRVGDPSLPIYQAPKLNLNLREPARAAAYRPGQIVLAQVAGRGYARVGGEMRVGNSFGAAITSFGDYCLVADVQPPLAQLWNVKPGGWLNAPFVRVRLTDDLSGVHPFKIRVTLDGQWVVPEYYNYQEALFVRWRGRLAPGRHELVVSLTDYAGNAREQRFTFYSR